MVKIFRCILVYKWINDIIKLLGDYRIYLGINVEIEDNILCRFYIISKI